MKLNAIFIFCLKITTHKYNLAPDGINYFDMKLLQAQEKRNNPLKRR